MPNQTNDREQTLNDPVIERLEELIAELQNIFLDIYSNYKRTEE